MITLEMVVAAVRTQFPGLWVAVDLGQSSCGYGRATAAVLDDHSKHVARLAFPDPYGSAEMTAQDALNGLFAAICAEKWERMAEAPATTEASK